MPSDARSRHPWQVPDCPGCGGHVFVDRATTQADWICHGCGETFDGDLLDGGARR